MFIDRSSQKDLIDISLLIVKKSDISCALSAKSCFIDNSSIKAFSISAMIFSVVSLLTAFLTFLLNCMKARLDQPLCFELP